MTNRNILFATDKLEKYGDIVGYLEKNDFPCVTTVKNGDEVLRYLSDHVPDFAILDVNLPVLDGFQLCKVMKSSAFKQCENVPVVLLSETYKTYLTFQLAQSAGAYSILHIPFAMDDLLRLIYNKFYPERVLVDKTKSLQYKAKVMIATNDPDMARALEHSMRTEGYGISVIQDAKEVIRALDAESPQIFFLHYDMPKLNGRDVLKRIKETMPETVVVVIAGRGSELLAIEFMRAGASDYIIQPFDEKIIARVCENAFRKYHMNLLTKHVDEVELKLHSLIQGMVDGVILMDAHGKTTLVNEVGKEMLKYFDINMAGDAILNLNNISVKEVYDEIFIKKQRYISYEVHTKRNEEKYFIVIASPLNGLAEGEKGIVLVLRDVTREYQLQYQVVKTERLYAVSNLIAGAAHELNNPLAGIQLCADLVSNEPSISEKAKKYLDRIQKETDQIQSVIKSLLTLTGNYTLSKEQVNTNEIIEEITEQKANQFEYADIKVIKLLDEKLPVIFVDRKQMQRVFLDIIENACASMGEITGEKRLTIRTEACRDAVKVIIADTGPGIPKEYLAKIFEPFFTAKNIKKSKGTGLGLSIAHSIVHQHNGTVYADSELGAGATFVIELPVHKTSQTFL